MNSIGVRKQETTFFELGYDNVCNVQFISKYKLEEILVAYRNPQIQKDLHELKKMYV